MLPPAPPPRRDLRRLTLGLWTANVRSGDGPHHRKDSSRTRSPCPAWAPPSAGRSTVLRGVAGEWETDQSGFPNPQTPCLASGSC